MYYFKTINNTTKQAERIIAGYKYATPCHGSSIYAIYERPSKSKAKAYWDWYVYFLDHGKIIDIRLTGNNFNFTIYCLLSEETCDSTTKEIVTTTNLYQITQCNNRVIKGVTI